MAYSPDSRPTDPSMMDSTTADLPDENQDDTSVTVMSVIRLIFHYFGVYVSLAIICVGIVGNFLSIVVFIKRRKQDRASAQYLGLLALVDFLNLSMIALHDWFHMNLHIVSQGRFSHDKYVESDTGCKFLMSIWNVLSFLSSWIIICFSIERCLVIWFPLKMAPIVSSAKPRKRALGILISIAVVMYLPNIYRIALRSLTPGHPERLACAWRADISQVEIYVFLFQILVIATALPCILVTVLNVLILVGIFHNRMDSIKSSTNADMRCVKNLLFVSSFYFIFMAPFSFTWSIYYIAEANDFHGFSAEAAKVLGEMAQYTTSLTYLNYAINPLLYTLSLDFYRAECKRLFCCMVEKI